MPIFWVALNLSLWLCILKGGAVFFLLLSQQSGGFGMKGIPSG